jgi:hypothetical protein
MSCIEGAARRGRDRGEGRGGDEDGDERRRPPAGPRLCCDVPCCTRLCYAVLCYAMLCYASLCYAMLAPVAARPPGAGCGVCPARAGMDGVRAQAADCGRLPLAGGRGA